MSTSKRYTMNKTIRTIREQFAYVDAATLGPWTWKQAYDDVNIDAWELANTEGQRILDDGSAAGEYNQEIDPHGPDAKFIARARTDMPLLVAVAEAAEDFITLLSHWHRMKEEEEPRERLKQALAALTEEEAHNGTSTED